MLFAEWKPWSRCCILNDVGDKRPRCYYLFVWHIDNTRSVSKSVSYIDIYCTVIPYTIVLCPISKGKNTPLIIMFFEKK